MPKKPSAPARRAQRDYVLDDNDYAILKLLQENCRRKDTDISRLLDEAGLKLGSAGVGIHIESLKKHGFIKKMTAIVNYAEFGAPLTAILTAKLIDSTEETQKAFRELAIAHPDVMEIHELLGDFDYILKIRVFDLGEMQTVAAKLGGNLAKVATHAVSRTHKEATELEKLDRSRVLKNIAS
jgi:DNA-binding Lrp family transcriptional regulator